MTNRNILTAILMSMTLASGSATTKGLTYPVAPTSDTVDNYFGIEVPDPFRPLENDTAAETAAWVEAERRVTDEYFSQIPFRQRLREKLSRYQDYVKTGIPSKAVDGRYYYYENKGLENQSTLYRKATLDGEAEVFLDPNKLSTDGTVALTGVFISPDGKYTAYTISRSGSDWTEIYVLDTETKELLSDHIQWAKFTRPMWWKDGFYYSAYDRPEEGKEVSEINENHRVYYHKLGTPQTEDTLFYEDPEHPQHFHTAYVPRDNHYIFIFGGGEGFGESIMYRDLDDPEAEWIVMEPSQDVIISIVGLVGDEIYFTTSIDAPRYRLMAAPISDPKRENWRTIIPERQDAVMDDVNFASDKLIVSYEKDASTHLSVFDLEGNKINDINLPVVGQVSVSSDRKHDEVFYNIVSYLYPWAHFRYDLATGESTMINEGRVEGFNPDDYVTEEAWYPSSDGTMVHLFMTRRKDLKPDGTNPVYLYGYGGFNISINPTFSASRLIWLKNGGIYVEANIRGGSENGEQWHIDGTKMNKLNVFNDFIAAAEYLISEGWTSPEHIAIKGESNGGLLVAACVNMRPDLFRVALPGVGVQDMMRYHLFTIGWNWAPDYGTSADSPEMAKYLRDYSPVHNVRNDGTPYPSILVTTADHDDRVVPAHSFKYAAALQAANTGDNPKIIRIDSKAGHGAGKPMSKVLDEWADVFSFIFYNLDIDPDTE